MRNSANSAQKTIYKQEEFKTFLNVLKQYSKDGIILGSWSAIAESIGVNRDTIADWRNQPEAKELLLEARLKILEKMKKVGKDDWRMWLQMLKLLGMDAPERIDATISSPIPILGGITFNK